MPIIIDEDYDIFLLHTNITTYAFGIGEPHLLIHFYWGPRLENVDEVPLIGVIRGASFTNPKGLIPLEFNSAWGMSYVENCLKVEFENGTRSIHFHYDSFKIYENADGKENLVVILKDDNYNFYIDLHYEIFEEEDIISRWIEVRNTETQEIKIEQILSALWNFPRVPDFTRLTHLFGSHAHEFQIARTILTPGKKVLESRRGSTGHYQNPFFMLDDGNASEDNGKVFFGAISWSGSWKIVAERTSHGYTRILGGINDYDFEYIIKSNEKFITPKFYAGFTELGFGQASRNLHDFQNQYILPKNKAQDIRKIIYNSWEVTKFNVNEEQQKELARIAADLGVEIFVMDDGWFGERNHDNAGLGDWEPNPKKFPRGLNPLINEVKKLGMEFGLWFEPEMVNPDSNLYRKHPDWVIKFPNRIPDQARNQLNLNLALNEVKEYVYSAVEKILSKYPDITYIKWDMNKSICDMPKKSMWYDYVINLYGVFSRLREKFPYLHIENCSGGGGRMDIGLMPYYDTNWTSDNTNPFHRLFIQEGFSFAYTPRVMSAWVTDSGIFDLNYRFHSSMMGIMGIGANIMKWSEEERMIAKKMINTYKKIRSLIQFGDLYRLKSPREENITAVEYVSKDKSQAIIFVFKNVSDLKGDIINVPVRGLAPNKIYNVPNDIGYARGKIVMEQGLITSLTGTNRSKLFQINER